MKKLPDGQDYFSNSNIIAGFNMFVSAHQMNQVPITNLHGYGLAEDLAMHGKIAFKRAFPCDCGSIPFLYGGFFVCNGCGRRGVDKPFWNIIVEKDGNQFCCHGLDFENLQESDNYAFGDTFEKAIAEYGNKMRVLQNVNSEGAKWK